MIHISMQGTMPRVVSKEQIDRAIRDVFRFTRRREQGSVDVAFVTERKIAALNTKYRGIRRPTDVLSFSPPPSAIRHSSFAIQAVPHWGEIVIAGPFAKKEAAARGVAFGEEIIRLVAHGMLHLCGYDHATKRDEKKMFGIQERIVEHVYE